MLLLLQLGAMPQVSKDTLEENGRNRYVVLGNPEKN